MRLSSLLLMAVLLAAISAQPDCAAKAFPPLIPMARGENQLLDLQNYFEGNNISFSVTPNNSFSYVDRGYECRKVSRDNLGRVVASKYLRKEQLLGVLPNISRPFPSPSPADSPSPPCRSTPRPSAPSTCPTTSPTPTAPTSTSPPPTTPTSSWWSPAGTPPPCSQGPSSSPPSASTRRSLSTGPSRPPRSLATPRYWAARCC